MVSIIGVVLLYKHNSMNNVTNHQVYNVLKVVTVHHECSTPTDFKVKCVMGVYLMLIEVREGVVMSMSEIMGSGDEYDGVNDIV